MCVLKLEIKIKKLCLRYLTIQLDVNVKIQIH